MTLLFADLVGSTELGGRQDPERTRALLERFYGASAAEIEVAGGTVEKFVGDAVMAAFGAPAAHEDHAERALHAALAVRNRVEELFGDTLALRMGVDTGEVVLGPAREGSSFVTGDAVNVAARLDRSFSTAGRRGAAAVATPPRSGSRSSHSTRRRGCSTPSSARSFRLRPVSSFSSGRREIPSSSRS